MTYKLRNKRLLFIGLIIAIYFIFITFVLFNKIILSSGTGNQINIGNLPIKIKSKAIRPKFYDRNGHLLATTIPTTSLYARPKKIFNAKETAKALSRLFPEPQNNLAQSNLTQVSDPNINLAEYSYEYFYKKLTSKRPFIWLKKDLSPKQVQDFLYLGIPGIYLQTDSKRAYIMGNLFSHLLGFVNSDNIGIAGLEYYLDKLESTSALNKEGKAQGITDISNISNVSNLVASTNLKYLKQINSIKQIDQINLTVDSRIQTILVKEIQKTIKEYEASGGAGIILNALNGEILALTSQPDFNPHQPKNASKEQKFNRATLGLYEYGSVMKIFTIGAALDTNIIGPEDMFDVSKTLKMDRFTIKDLYPPKKPEYSIADIINHSSNIGMAKIALLCGAKRQQQYYEQLKFFKNSNIEIPEKSSAILPKRYGSLRTVTISYGYGVVATLLHIAQGMATILNEGCTMPVSLFKKPFIAKNESSSCERALSPETTKYLTELMTSVVKIGTGKRARVESYNVLGKTGSAEKNFNGVYNKKLNISSFLGGFYDKDNYYVIAIMIDEPKSAGLVTGGLVVAPIVKSVIEKVAPLLNLSPVSQNIS